MTDATNCCLKISHKKAQKPQKENPELEMKTPFQKTTKSQLISLCFLCLFVANGFWRFSHRVRVPTCGVPGLRFQTRRHCRRNCGRHRHDRGCEHNKDSLKWRGSNPGSRHFHRVEEVDPAGG